MRYATNLLQLLGSMKVMRNCILQVISCSEAVFFLIQLENTELNVFRNVLETTMKIMILRNSRIDKQRSLHTENETKVNGIW